MKDYDQFRGEEYYQEWPPFSPADLRRKETVVQITRQMLMGAMTAPFAGGVQQIEGHIVYGQAEQEKLARKMEEMAYTNSRWEEIFKYEAVMVREADAVLFLGNYRCHETPLDAGCGLCGGRADCSYFYEKVKHKFGSVDITDRRSETPIKGPLCSARVDDLGYAVGSALWLAVNYLVDARPFMSVGMAGKQLGYCPNSGIVVGILVAAQAKNPFVDICPEYHLFNMSKIVDTARKQYITARTVTTFDYHRWIPKPKKEEESQ